MALPTQGSFAELGTPLHAVTFVVVDLETTGGSPHDSRITEFGAVKIRGGEIVGEFQSLVDPCQSIPASISALTGITNAMVATRPAVEAVLPTFLEFCAGATLVAHNARFDVGFLNAGLERLSYPRLENPVVCTASLARRLVRDEVRDCKLATLAQRFATRTVPNHRALSDARATVEVFHSLLERAGSYGVVTLEDLVQFSRVRNAPLFASRRHLAEGLPSAPGVYAFASASGEILYVGKASDLRSRVRSYFGNDDRRKIVDLMKETEEVRHWECPTTLEAAVREVRLIGEHSPRFNRRSKHPQRGAYLKLTHDRFPRLSVVRDVKAGEIYLGPLPSRRTAESVAEAINEVLPLRRCTMRIGASTRAPACVLGQIGRCLSPCDGSVDVAGYAKAVDTAIEAMTGDPRGVVWPLLQRMERLSSAGRYEEAADVRNRLRSFVAALERTRRLRSLTAAGALVASRPARGGGWDVINVASGRLVSSAHRRSALETHVAEAVGHEVGLPLEASGRVGVLEAEEVDLVSRWLEGRGVRVHRCDGGLAQPAPGGQVVTHLLDRLARAARATGRPEAELASKRTRRAPAAEPTPATEVFAAAR